LNKSEILPEKSFNCPIESSGPKSYSVHKLRFSDIDVIGAIGDSITAGFGAKAIVSSEITIENRGVSW
jgi:phospholipase B1